MRSGRLRGRRGCLRLLLFSSIASQAEALQQFSCQLNRHDVDKLTFQNIFDPQFETNHNQHAAFAVEMVAFELVKIIQCIGFRCRNIHQNAEEIRKRRGSSTHHLVHNLTDSAYRQLIKLKFLIRRLGTHKDIDDRSHIAALEQHDVAPIQARNIFDFHGDRRFQIAKRKIFNGNDRHRRRGDIDPMVQHIGNCSGGRTEADIHHLADGVQLHRIKDLLFHIAHFPLFPEYDRYLQF